MTDAFKKPVKCSKIYVNSIILMKDNQDDILTLSIKDVDS